MEEGLVSVVIPFYRGAEWLRVAIESVLSQTYGNIELIVVVDGAKEDISLVENLYKERVTFIHQENQGAAAARNRGIDVAKGKYVAFLDADDLWVPNKIQLQVSHMEKHGFVWCHADYIQFWDDGSRENQYRSCNIEGEIFPYCFLRCPIATPNVIILRRVLRENLNLRFKEGMKWGEDSFLWRNLGRLYPLGYLSEALSKVRMRGWNAMSLASVQIISRGEDFRLIREEKSNMPLWLYLFLRIILGWCYVASHPIKLVCRGEYKNGWRELLAKVLYSPAFLGIRALSWQYNLGRKRDKRIQSNA